MNQRSFDRLTQTLAQRSTRRSALAAGAGLGGLALAGAESRLTAAQESSPVSSPVATGNKLFFLFVQTFEGGSLAPKEGEEGTYVLKLHGGHGHTIAFSDRPDRIVVSVPTQEFLDGLGFTPDNPPNAALVISPEPGETDIIVVELLNPQYDEAAQALTYDVKVLDSFESQQGMDFVEEPRPPHADGEEFGAAELFIDDCPDSVFNCSADGQLLGTISYGQCWSWDSWTCSTYNYPCLTPTNDEVAQRCLDTY